MTPIPNNTKVIVTAENNQKFKGKILNSGTQAQLLMYAVLLDEPENYPGIETGVKVVEVPFDKVNFDIEALRDTI